ncbi:MAG: type IV secretion protein IcmS [Gammaproteobacteria bacterium]|nr:type IV secretion protein IcmS [Gammaproteobacteria bacterium]
MSKKLISIASVFGVKFQLRNKEISKEQIFSPTGLLPAIARRADQLCALCLGYGIGVSFDESEGSMLGVKVVFDDVTPSTVRYLCIIDVLNELIHSSTSKDMVVLDELMYD